MQSLNASNLEVEPQKDAGKSMLCRERTPAPGRPAAAGLQRVAAAAPAGRPLLPGKRGLHVATHGQNGTTGPIDNTSSHKLNGVPPPQQRPHGSSATSGSPSAPSSNAPSPASSSSGGGGSPSTSRDSAAARGKRLQQHARRELLSRAWAVVAGGAADVARFRGRCSITPPAHAAARAAAATGSGSSGGSSAWSRAAVSEALGRLLYRYYLWRQNTLNDLQLIMGVSMSLLLLGAGVRHALLGSEATSDAVGGAAGDLGAEMMAWWGDMYQVMLTSFGEAFPSSGACSC